jgi:type III pantothenate kinase
MEIDNRYTIAVDIGNTNTDIGLIDLDTITCLKKSSCPSDNTNAHRIIKFFNDNAIEKETPVRICSVVSSLRESIESTLSSGNLGSVTFLRYHKNLPIKINYRKPESLGIDRIANCLFGVKKYPDENLIIIDIGTAVTVDVLTEKREFLGGYIFPGPETQLKSLHKGTFQLPHLEYSIGSVSIPPDSTRDAMIGGTGFSVAGGISFIISKIIQQTGKDYRILSCGGGWKSIENLIEIEYTFIKNLTLIGIGLYEQN